CLDCFPWECSCRTAARPPPEPASRKEPPLAGAGRYQASSLGYLGSFNNGLNFFAVTHIVLPQGHNVYRAAEPGHPHAVIFLGNYIYWCELRGIVGIKNTYAKFSGLIEYEHGPWQFLGKLRRQSNGEFRGHTFTHAFSGI